MAENLLQIGKIKGVIHSKLILKGTISKPTFIGGEEYKGSYEVTPKVEAQTIPTKDKVLIEDMTIKAIPIFKVSNTTGGNTVFIGNEV